MYYDIFVKYKFDRKGGVNIVIYDRPFADSVIRMNQDELQLLYDSCFDSVKNRVDRCIYTMGMDTERQALVTDVMYLSIVGKTLAAVSLQPLNLYDFIENEDGELELQLIVYEPDVKDGKFLTETAFNYNQFLSEYEQIVVAEDHPDVWK